MRGKPPRNVRARLPPRFIPAPQVPYSGTLIHSWSSNDQLSAPGQNSVGTVGQNSIGTNNPWRKLTIAIDGVDNSGKSTLGRFLAWQLGMPVIETDLLLDREATDIKHDLSTLRRLLSALHDLNRPAIVEGVLVLRTLERVSVSPEYLVYVEAKGRGGSHTWQGEFAQYAQTYLPRERAQFTFAWVPENAS